MIDSIAPLRILSGFLNRFVDRVRVSIASSTVFATVGTASVALVIVPVLSVVYDMIFGNDMHAPDYARIGYAAALVSLCVSVASGIVSQIATDRNLGVFQEVHARRLFDFAYWLGCAVVPVVLSVVTATVTVLGVFFLTQGSNPNLLVHAICLAPVAVVVGILMGVACAGIGVSLPDPYLGATILSSVLPLSAGVIVPTSLYPTWLSVCCRLIPMTGIIDSLGDVPSSGGTGTADRVSQMVLDGGFRPGFDIAMALAWAMVGLAFIGLAMHRLRNGVRRDII